MEAVVHYMDRETLHLDCDEPDDAARATFEFDKVTCTKCRVIHEGGVPLEYIEQYRIPAEVAGQPFSVRIGPCVYGRYPGKWYAYQVQGEFNARGLRKDGSWQKYGESFDSAEEAYATLLATNERWGS